MQAEDNLSEVELNSLTTKTRFNINKITTDTKPPFQNLHTYNKGNANINNKDITSSCCGVKLELLPNEVKQNQINAKVIIAPKKYLPTPKSKFFTKLFI